jgi:hypothetical protein
MDDLTPKSEKDIITLEYIFKKQYQPLHQLTIIRGMTQNDFPNRYISQITLQQDVNITKTRPYSVRVEMTLLNKIIL